MTDENGVEESSAELMSVLADMMAMWAEIATGHKNKLIAMGWYPDSAEAVALAIHLQLVQMWGDVNNKAQNATDS